MPRQLMKTSQWHTRWAEGLCARREMHREDVTAGRLREGARLPTPGQKGAGTGLPMPSRERAHCCSCEQHVLPRPQPQSRRPRVQEAVRRGTWSPPCASRGTDGHITGMAGNQ